MVEDRPPAPIFADAIDDSGSLGGLYTALLVSPGDGTIVLAGDMPWVEASLFEELLRRRHGADAVVPESDDGLHPLCAWYGRSLALDFKGRIDRGELRIRDALAGVRMQAFRPADSAAFDPDGTMLMNVNTTADYERACQAARQRA
jgi:molybdenum cofactor guanylyltransferase